MKDIFDAKIICEKCNTKMEKFSIDKKGFRMRAIECKKCGDKIVHPKDLGEYNHFNDLKRKSYNVKLRIIGNSHAVSIPKEIVDFINDSHQRMKRQMNNMVKLCFDDFGKLSLDFFDNDRRRRVAW
jgi:tRNA(Ile2) C34 agmatinyltransferase TiaS